jgi:DNA-binding NarL/FixJ family response regulator
MVMEPMRVLIVNGHPMVLREIVRYFEELPPGSYEVAGAAFRVDDALALALLHHPQAVVLGLSNPAGPGLPLLPELRRIVPHARIVVLASVALAEYTQAAVAAGADACIDGHRLHTDLIPALQAAV